jgi:hypothetical protein
VTVLIAAVAVVGLIVLVSLTMAGMRRRHRHQLLADFGAAYEQEPTSPVPVIQGPTGGVDGRHRRQLVQRWAEIQLRFVDQPSSALHEAELLVDEVRRFRGLPEPDAADTPDVTDTSTEGMRQRLLHQRAAFRKLIG